MALVKNKKIHSISDKSARATKDRPVIADTEIKTIAEDIFGKLLEEGCKTNDIINISSQLIELISNEMICDKEPRQGKRLNISRK